MSSNELSLATNDPFLQGDSVKKLESDPFLIQKPEGNQIKYLYLDEVPAEPYKDYKAKKNYEYLQKDEFYPPRLKKEKPYISKNGSDDLSHYNVSEKTIGDDSHVLTVMLIISILALVVLCILANRTKNRSCTKSTTFFGRFFKTIAMVEKRSEIKNYILGECEKAYSLEKIKKEYLAEVKTYNRDPITQEELDNLSRNLKLASYVSIDALVDILQDIHKEIKTCFFSAELKGDDLWYTHEIKTELATQFISYTGNDYKEVLKNILYARLREELAAENIKNDLLSDIVNASEIKKNEKKTSVRKKKPKSEADVGSKE